METNSFPLVSIIITSYNRAGLISKAIESALAQDYPNLEIIISDNCSTDETDQVIRKYTNDSRIKYSRNVENIGMLPNFRKATYELAKGDYITYVSSDDYLTDNSFISDAINLVKNNSDIRLVYGKLKGNNIENGVIWEMPESPYFTKDIRDGKEVFFMCTESFLLSWGACLMEKKSMMEVETLQSDFFNVDIDSNYKIMLLGNIGFINRVCYLQLGHVGNNGFPVDAGKIINSMKCYQQVAEYALKKIPDDADRVQGWKDYFINFTIKWAFYHLKSRSETEFRKFKQGMKLAYPLEYKKFTGSRAYFRFALTQSIRSILPKGIEKRIKNIRRQAK